MTLRPIPQLLLVVALIGGGTVACNRAPENKDAVRQGLMEHLGKNTGLDLKSMDVEVGNVTFEGNTATAVVSFKPKATPDAGMTMNYKLDRKGSKWVVQEKSGSGAGHATGMGESTMPPAGGEPLPPGHPSVAPGAGAKGAPSELPAGHPPVSGQTAQPKTK